MRSKILGLISKLIFCVVIALSLYLLYEIRINARNEQAKQIELFEKNSIGRKMELDEEEKPKDNHAFSIADAYLSIAGVLYIPDIDLKIPVYDNTSEYALSNGTGIVPTTGDLSGKMGINPVITSHNGSATKDLFMSLNKLGVDDEFYIKNEKDEVLKYSVFDIRVVTPEDEWEKLLPAKQNESIMTLRTCTPTGVNSHRLLVTARMVGQVQEENIPVNDKVVVSDFEVFLIASAVISSALLVIFIILDLKTRRKNKNETK